MLPPAPRLVPPERCPKYLQLAKGFERQLQTGALRVGDRLPSVRQLGDEHQVSVSTAISCYMWLERQGYIRARPKSGFYVRRLPVSDGAPPAVTTRAKGPVAVRLSEIRTHIAAMDWRTEGAQLGPAVVGPALLPMNRLNRSLRLALAASADNAVRYEDPRGNLRLRRQIARLVFRQGASLSPDDILVTSGETEALNLCLRAVAKAGDVVAVDSPGCYAILHALEAFQMRAVEIPHVPGQGMDRGLLAEAVRKHRVKAIVLVATCHSAFGDCDSEESKADLVSFATRQDIPVIEGDPFGDLVYSGRRPRPLKAFDTSGIVLQCNSLAHYIAPGFNVGWASGGRWHPELERLKAFSNVAGARLPQLALAEFLESGAFEKHLKQLRLALWKTVEASRQEILATFPEGTRVTRPEGGFVLWIELPDAYDGVLVQRQAAAAGVTILAGSLFSPTRQYRHCIRVSCGHPFEVMRPALRTLARLFTKLHVPDKPRKGAGPTFSS
jgi:DNA-binding transcriptional MocR family regulator